MKIKVSVVLGLLLCFSTLALAQTDTARVFGTITDPTGAVIPNATVTVTDTATGHAVGTKTGPSGDYALNALPVGKYHAEVKQDGFKTLTIDFALDVSQVLELSLQLETGSTATTVDVTSAVPLVDTATSSAGEVIQGAQVTELPLNGRNFTSLALLTPGVSRGQYSNNANAPNNNAETWRNSESGGAALAVDGLRPQSNNFILDGIDDNDSMVNTIVIFPAIEDIAEFIRVDVDRALEVDLASSRRSSLARFSPRLTCASAWSGISRTAVSSAGTAASNRDSAEMNAPKTFQPRPRAGKRSVNARASAWASANFRGRSPRSIPFPACAPPARPCAAAPRARPASSPHPPAERRRCRGGGRVRACSGRRGSGGEEQGLQITKPIIGDGRGRVDRGLQIRGPFLGRFCWVFSIPRE